MLEAVIVGDLDPLGLEGKSDVQLSDVKGLVILGGVECVILLLLVEALTRAGEASIEKHDIRSSRSPDVHVHVTLYFLHWSCMTDTETAKSIAHNFSNALPNQ